MWELHNLLKDSLKGDETEYLIDTVSNMLDRLSSHSFTSVMHLLYKKLDLSKANPVYVLTLFVRGLQANEYFNFSDFVKGLNHGRS